MTVQSTAAAFSDRHIGVRREADIDAMLKAIGYDSIKLVSAQEYASVNGGGL